MSRPHQSCSLLLLNACHYRIKINPWIRFCLLYKNICCEEVFFCNLLALCTLGQWNILCLPLVKFKKYSSSQALLSIHVIPVSSFNTECCVISVSCELICSAVGFILWRKPLIIISALVNIQSIFGHFLFAFDFTPTFCARNKVCSPILCVPHILCLFTQINWANLCGL